MKIYESIHSQYIKQSDINEKRCFEITIKEEPKSNYLFDFSVTKTIFDYEVGNSYPPCANFLENFLTSKVFVFSLPIGHDLFSNCDITNLYKQKLEKYDGTPKNIFDNEFVVGWTGVEQNEKITLISNIQINGLLFNSLERVVAKNLYRNFLKFTEKQFYGDILVPTHETLRKLVMKLRYHPNSSIMESPYTSQIVKGFKKKNFIIDGPCKKYLLPEEMIFWTKNNTKSVM